MPRTHRNVGSKSTPVRHSVTLPPSLATEVERLAKERRMTVAAAIVALTERGMRAELESPQDLRNAYARFMEERDPKGRDAAGKDLIRAIFGKDAVADDPLL